MLRLSNRILTKLSRIVMSLYLRRPQNVWCNLCGWSGRYFTHDSWHAFTICPKCSSEVRHRLLICAMTYIDELSFAAIVKNKRVLHFAPETYIGLKLQKYASKYLTADYSRRNVDIRLDISHMSSFEDSSFDLLIACDVLEHVPDDTQAIKEIYRILKTGGYAIIAVPQMDHSSHTFEDPNITSPLERERVFGQHDHLRIYGDDFPERLESEGFKVTVISETDFSRELVNKHVLFPPVLSENPLATNYRKIFFNRKLLG